jgi:hypothetical protein
MITMVTLMLLPRIWQAREFARVWELLLSGLTTGKAESSSVSTSN